MKASINFRVTKSAIAVGALIAGLAVGGAISAGAAPSSITVCALKSSGQLRYGKSGTCKSTETKLVLGEIGPSGPSGIYTGVAKISTITASKSLNLQDLGSTFVITKSVVIEVPTDASVAFPVGTTINLAQTQGQTFVSGAIGVTVNGTISTNDLPIAAFDTGGFQYGVLVKIAANSWALLTQSANK